MDKTLESGILLVEEKQETLNRMKIILEERMYSVSATRDLHEATDIANNKSPRLILINADMRGGRGMEKAKDFKTNSKTKDIPVIILTTPYKTKEFIEDCMKMGADGIIFVPFDEMDFLVKVHVGIRIKNLVEEIKHDEERILKIEEDTKEIREKEGEYKSRIKELEDKLYRERITDELTGLYNRREFMRQLEAMIFEAVRYEEPIVLFLYDIDHLNTIEKEYGSEAAEVLLKGFSEIVKKHSRIEDVCGRYGGDKFIVAYKRMRYDFIDPIAKRILNDIQNAEVTYNDINIKFSASLGISCNIYHSTHRFEDREEALHEVFLALRNAKRRGSGQIFTHPIVKKE